MVSNHHCHPVIQQWEHWLCVCWFCLATSEPRAVSELSRWTLAVFRGLWIKIHDEETLGGQTRDSNLQVVSGSEIIPSFLFKRLLCYQAEMTSSSFLLWDCRSYVLSERSPFCFLSLILSAFLFLSLVLCLSLSVPLSLNLSVSLTLSSLPLTNEGWLWGKKCNFVVLQCFIPGCCVQKHNFLAKY